MSVLPVIPGYEVLHSLGSGGFADVFAARDTRVERVVAIKVLRENSPAHAQVDRFRREREALAQLDHPHVLRIHSTGSSGGHPYVVTELLSGGTLADRLLAGAGRDEAVGLLVQAARGAGALHAAGLVHRDLKPANLLLDEHGQIKVADLGLVAGSDLRTLTSDGSLVGTAAYMSPELCLGERERNPASDVYSLGVILFEVLTGKLPHTGPVLVALLAERMDFPNPDPSLHVPGLPRALVAVCRKAMEREAEDRYPNGEAFAEALSAATGGSPLPRKGQRGWGTRTLLGAGLILALVLGVRWLRSDRPLSPEPPPAVAVVKGPLGQGSPPRLGAFDVPRLAQEVREGKPGAAAAAARWVARHPSRLEEVEALREAATLGGLERAPLHSYTLPVDHRAHAPVGWVLGSDALLWIETCPPYCTREHPAPSRVVRFEGETAIELDWPGYAVTATGPQGTYLAAYRGANQAGVLYRHEAGELHEIAELPISHATSLVAGEDVVVVGSGDGRVVALDSTSGEVLWNRVIYRHYVSGVFAHGAAWAVTSGGEESRPLRLLAREDGREVAWLGTLPPLGGVRWGRRLASGELLLCMSESNVVYGLTEKAQRVFKGVRQLGETRSLMTGQWSPDSGLTSRSGIAVGNALILIGSRRVTDGPDSQYRVFSLTSSEERGGARETKWDYCTSTYSAGLMALGSVRRQQGGVGVVDVRRVTLPDPE